MLTPKVTCISSLPSAHTSGRGVSAAATVVASTARR
jgi:hypothetical protein